MTPTMATMGTQSCTGLDEIVSPELALVDPDLATRARARLPHPGEREAIARMSAQLDRSLAASRSRGPRTASRRNNFRAHGRLGAGLVAASTLVAILWLGDVRIEFGSSRLEPAAVEEPALDVAAPPSSEPAPAVPANASGAAPPAPRAAPRPTKQRKRPATRTGPRRTTALTEPQRFAWAPSRGATAYHVELFRGDARVFAANTKRPAITIPARWTFDGRTRTLGPGEYRWYVWPWKENRREGAAIVQARLTVSR